MDLIREIDKVADRAVADVSYDFAAGRAQGVVEARAVVKRAAERVRELEEENQKLRERVAKWERLQRLAAEAARPDLITRTSDIAKEET